MDYVHTLLNTYIRYYVSDMILHIDSDAAYLVAPKTRSRVARYLHLSDHMNITEHPKLNGAIFVECKTLQHELSSASKTKVAGISHNSQLGIPIINLLHKLNHMKPPIPPNLKFELYC